MPEERKEKIKFLSYVGLLALVLSFSGTLIANAFWGGRYAEKVDKLEVDFQQHQLQNENEYLRKSQFEEYKQARSDFQDRVLKELDRINNKLDKIN